MSSKQSGAKPSPHCSESLPRYRENTLRDIKVVNTGPYVAVYVIGARGGGQPLKIGMAKRPDARLSTLQTGVWMKLELLEIRWVKSLAHARKVEREAHQILAAAGKAMLGEWFDVTPDKALEAIEWAALTCGVELLHDGDLKVEPLPEMPLAYRTVDMHMLTEEERAFASRARQHRRLKKAGQL